MRIRVIHTGGTIGMVQTEAGFAPKAGLLEGALDEMQAKGQLSVAYDLIAAEPLIDSAEAQPADWNWIAADIASHHADYDGFVVTHGTDSLSFTAAALALALGGLAKPVILTGSMVPLSVAGNDGLRNLGDAMAAVHTAGPGVWVQFAGHLLPGARVQKLHSTGFEAFAALGDFAPSHQGGDVVVRHPFADHEVAIVTVAPGLRGHLVGAALSGADGVILRCFGSGTVPDREGFRAALMAATARDVPILAISQCPQGGMVIGTYAAGALLVDAKAIDGRDLTLEAAYAKMMMALSRFDDIEARRIYLAQPQCAEMTV